MFCPKCGNQVPDNAKFCPACGNQFAAAPAPAPRPVAGNPAQPGAATFGALHIATIVVAALLLICAFAVPLVNCEDLSYLSSYASYFGGSTIDESYSFLTLGSAYSALNDYYSLVSSDATLAVMATWCWGNDFIFIIGLVLVGIGIALVTKKVMGKVLMAIGFCVTILAFISAAIPAFALTSDAASYVFSISPASIVLCGLLAIAGIVLAILCPTAKKQQPMPQAQPYQPMQQPMPQAQPYQQQMPRQ